MASTTSARSPVPANDPRAPQHLQAQPPDSFPRHLRTIVFAFALLNAVLYTCFLPLWEGFDEPFHYGYVQELAAARFPVFGQATVSQEVLASLKTVPLSRFLSGTAGSPSFEEWFALPATDRQARVNTQIPPALRGRASTLQNYEAQQAPLAYALLAPFDLALSRMQIRWRILFLRLIVSVAAVFLLWAGVTRLCRVLNLALPWSLPAAACIFSSQMLWATVAHVGNDYFAVPLTLLFLAWLATAAQTGHKHDWIALCLIFAAGLLTKAYFLAFAPVVILILLIRKQPLLLGIPTLVAGPWYLHNRLLYGSFSGTQQSVAGIGFLNALSAVPQIPWLNSTLAFLHWSLWTGNWSFLSFSKSTLNLELLLLGCGLLLYFRFYRTISMPQRWCLFACACFLGALVYQTCVTYIHTHGESLFAEPWYWQGIVCFLVLLVFRGFQQASRAGQVLAAVTVLLTAWVAFVTYVAKLLPMYGGGFQRATIKAVWIWWTSHPTRDLNTVALTCPWILYFLLVAFVLVLAVQTMAVCRALTKG